MSTDRSFNQRLSQTCDVRGHVCVGLDPDPDEYLKLASLAGWRPGIADYCKFVIEAIGACIFVDDLAASEVEASCAELRALHAEFDS